MLIITKLQHSMVIMAIWFFLLLISFKFQNMIKRKIENVNFRIYLLFKNKNVFNNYFFH